MARGGQMRRKLRRREFSNERRNCARRKSKICAAARATSQLNDNRHQCFHKQGNKKYLMVAFWNRKVIWKVSDIAFFINQKIGINKSNWVPGGAIVKATPYTPQTLQ